MESLRWKHTHVEISVLLAKSWHSWGVPPSHKSITSTVSPSIFRLRILSMCLSTWHIPVVMLFAHPLGLLFSLGCPFSPKSKPDTDPDLPNSSWHGHFWGSEDGEEPGEEMCALEVAYVPLLRVCMKRPECRCMYVCATKAAALFGSVNFFCEALQVVHCFYLRKESLFLIYIKALQKLVVALLKTL